MKERKLNTDKELVNVVKEGLKQRGGYCPCKVEKVEDNKCPCKEERENQLCHCGLYVYN